LRATLIRLAGFGNRLALIQRSALSARVSKDGPRASWFETAQARLLTMRIE
jgi:hypothetical protein